MALPRERFAGELGHEIRARRSFGAHWRRIEEGLVSEAGVHTFAKQLFVQVCELPRAVPALQAQAGVRRTVGTSLGVWWRFFDGIEHEVNAA